MAKVRSAELIAPLQTYPPDGLVYACEGEITGLVMQDATGAHELGVIPCDEKPPDGAIESAESERPCDPGDRGPGSAA
ncbi:MAG TPA: hypothetical protein VIH59_20010 [Candidatus Tectomicrobia bacterium]|jgi:hypothetical protein